MKVVVIDTCILRYALEAEAGIRSDEIRKKVLKNLLDILKRKDIVVVFNTETISEYSKHIEIVRKEIRRRSRVNLSFRILRILKKSVARFQIESSILSLKVSLLEEKIFTC